MANVRKPRPAKPSPRKRRTLEKALPPAPGAGWWGDGPSPSARWPGVTIELPSVWNPHFEIDVVDKETRETERVKVGRWESPDGRYYFDQAAADKAVDFFPEFLTHHIGEFAGQPFHLLEYQELLIVRPVFGWKRVDNGLRRFRKSFDFIPKGNGKSPLGAGIALFLMECDDEPSAEVYAVAGDKEQARVVHNDAKIFVEDSQELDNMCEVLKDSIFDPTTRSSLKVLSSDASTKHGFRPHGVIFDEFHNQRRRDLFEALDRSMIKRRQPLMFIISHAGDDDEGICFEEYELAKAVLSGTSENETLLPVIFEAKPEDDWKDPEVWKRVNPALGSLVKLDALRTGCQDATVEPRKRNDFLRFHLNRWVNQAIAWIPVDWWDACEGVLDEQLLQTLPIAAGLDLSQKYDLTSLVLTFLEFLEGPAQTVTVVGTEGDGVDDKPVTRELSLNFKIHVVPYFWLPEATLEERVKQDRVPYHIWREKGLLRVTEGSVIDYDTILKDITGPITARFPKLHGAEIGYDPAFATDLAIRLNARGYTAVEILQNYKHMSEPCMVLEALLKAKRVNHDGNRVLRWNYENVAIKRDDAGRIRPVKPKKAAKRIDGVVATIMGTSRLVLQAGAPAPEIYVMRDQAPREDDAGEPNNPNPVDDLDEFEEDPWNQ